MPVRIRLMRMGAKKRPFYRIIVTKSTSPREGRSIEQIGYYDPLTEPSNIKLRVDRAAAWLKLGAVPSDPVVRILRREGLLPAWDAPPPAPPEKRVLTDTQQVRAEARKASRKKRVDEGKRRETAALARRQERRTAKKAAAEAAAG